VLTCREEWINAENKNPLALFRSNLFNQEQGVLLQLLQSCSAVGC
jgi:hypothetical protein